VTPPKPRYTLITTPHVRRQLTDQLPEAVAAATLEFITGPLLDNPHRVGRRLSPPLNDRYSARRGTYRVLYRIDDDNRTVAVLAVIHRRADVEVEHGSTGF
jgi:mRNA interferase RelE/StbE